MITSLRAALVKSDCSPSPKVKQFCCINVVETDSHYAASRVPYIELYLPVSQVREQRDVPPCLAASWFLATMNSSSTFQFSTQEE